MTQDGARRSRRRTSPAERRARHAAIDDPAVVFDAALRFLETRSRSTAEVVRRLRTAGYDAVLVEGAVTRLLEMGILDDAAFAAAWIASRDRARPRGARALRSELSAKGVDSETIARVLEAREAAALERDDGLVCDDGTRPGDDTASADDGAGSADLAMSADEQAARRLLERHARALARETDPRKRRSRAYALLARSGFDPDVCRTASIAFLAEMDDA